MTKAQMSIEMLGLAAVLILVLVVFAAVSFTQQTQAFQARDGMDGAAVCRLVASHVNAASSVGDGYSAEMVLPDFLASGSDYEVQLLESERRVRAVWESGFCEIPVLGGSFSGSVNKGYNVVRNEGGVIVFS